MATAAQIAANRSNARRSTGPRTPAGKAVVARNAATLDLFSLHAKVPAQDQPFYDRLRESLFTQLAPATALEEMWANEILRASWRLDLCARNDAGTSLELDYTTNLRASIERARTEAHRLLERATNQLRRLRTERARRDELLHDADSRPKAGLAQYGELLRSLPARRRWQMFTGAGTNDEIAREPAEASAFRGMPAAAPQSPEIPHNTEISKQSQFSEAVGRTPPAPAAPGLNTNAVAVQTQRPSSQYRTSTRPREWRSPFNAEVRLVRPRPPYFSGSAKTYNACPEEGGRISGAIVFGTWRGLPPPSPVVTATY